MIAPLSDRILALFIWGGLGLLVWFVWWYVRRLFRALLSHIAVAVVTVRDDIEQIERNRSEPAP
jgi:hypothetical protein